MEIKLIGFFLFILLVNGCSNSFNSIQNGVIHYDLVIADSEENNFYDFLIQEKQIGCISCAKIPVLTLRDGKQIWSNMLTDQSLISHDNISNEIVFEIEKNGIFINYEIDDSLHKYKQYSFDTIRNPFLDIPSSSNTRQTFTGYSKYLGDTSIEVINKKYSCYKFIIYENTNPNFPIYKIVSLDKQTAIPVAIERVINFKDSQTKYKLLISKIEKK